MTCPGSVHEYDWLDVGVGEHWFGGGSVRLTTLLGSCVAICLWHPARRVGGLAHILLPGRRRGERAELLDSRYADEAVELLRTDVETFGTRLRDYDVKLFGGGDMLEVSGRRTGVMDVGRRNIEAVESLMVREGVNIRSRHLGGQGHRKLVFDIVTGAVWLKFPGGKDALMVKQEGSNDR